MPEMYRPWPQGRMSGDGGGADSDGVDDGADGADGSVGGASIPALRHADGRLHNGFIGGIVMLDLAKLRALQWPTLWRAELRRWLSLRQQATDGAANDGSGAGSGGPAAAAAPAWQPELNDQDVFNAVLTLRPELAYTIPCAWNLQYHAFMTSQRLCSSDEPGAIGSDRSDRGPNCAAMVAERMFVCAARPAVVHYMTRSYLLKEPPYFTSHWAAMAATPLSLLRYEHLVGGRCGMVADVEV